MISVSANDKSTIGQLINEAPGNYFSLKGQSGIKLRRGCYKAPKRREFAEKLNAYLESNLAGEGVYQVLNGNSTSAEPIFLIQKGGLPLTNNPVIIQESQSSDIALVKENAELRAKLYYLEKQLSELQADLEETDKALEEAPDPIEKPNPWFKLAEELAPAAGQLIAALAAKMLNPTIPNDESQRTRVLPKTPMAVRNAGPNAGFPDGTVPSERPEGTDNLQSGYNPRPGVRYRNSPAEAEYE